MDLLNALARTDIDPALLAQVRALFDRQQADLAQRDAALARRDALLGEKDFKITALTHELAYYRRIVSGKPAALYPSSVRVATISSMYNTMEIGHGWNGSKTIG